MDWSLDKLIKTLSDGTKGMKNLLVDSDGNNFGVEDNPLTVKRLSSNEVELNDSVEWFENTSAGTKKESVASLPAEVTKDNKYEILIYNTSTVSSITVDFQIKWNDIDANERFSTLDSINVDSSTGEAKVIDGAMLGEGIKVLFSNDSNLDLNEGFKAYVQVREV